MVNGFKTGAATFLVSALLFSLGGSHSASAQNPFPLVLVDKLKNQIFFADYDGDKIALRKNFHVTLGKAAGDKEVEKDLKTPEGIYFFTTRLVPPGLKKKFGKLALMLNYPNPIDRMAGKTGYDIMLHATDDPSRLTRDRDSEGCVVIDNDQIEEIASKVRLGLTPIVIYPELKPEYLRADGKPEVRQAFDRWFNAWKNKDLETYIGSYADQFHYNGMNLKQYREYKKSLNQRYASIDVKADNLRFYYHPKYDVAVFTQRYESKTKGGHTAFKSNGTKIVYFVGGSAGAPIRIVEESYSNLLED